MDGDRKLLEYADIVLRARDVSTLARTQWLNDQIMSFYFDYLKAKADDLRIELIQAATVQLVLWTEGEGEDDELGPFLDPLDLGSKELVLLPVNNSDSPMTPESGSHWSLLVYQRSHGGGSFFHFDSLPGTNEAQARALSRKLGMYLKAGGGFHGAEMPRQTNMSDCGVYVLAAARVLVRDHASAIAGKGAALDLRTFFGGQRDVKGLGEMVGAMRTEILATIRKLRLG